jgi:protein-S-isoprenylcysteine O-methyltransferase Ste14
MKYITNKWTRRLMFSSWAVLIFISIINYVYVPDFNNIVMAAGIAISISVIALRIKSKLIPGKYFKGDITVTREQIVITDSVYKYIRHPGYAGNILQSIGMPLILNACYSLSISTVFITAVFIRIYYEEKILSGKLPGYKEYMMKTKRIIPFLL